MSANKQRVVKKPTLNQPLSITEWPVIKPILLEKILQALLGLLENRYNESHKNRLKQKQETRKVGNEKACEEKSATIHGKQEIIDSSQTLPLEAKNTCAFEFSTTVGRKSEYDSNLDNEVSSGNSTTTKSKKRSRMAKARQDVLSDLCVGINSITRNIEEQISQLHNTGKSTATQGFSVIFVFIQCANGDDINVTSTNSMLVNHLPYLVQILNSKSTRSSTTRLVPIALSIPTSIGIGSQVKLEAENNSLYNSKSPFWLLCKYLGVKRVSALAIKKNSEYFASVVSMVNHHTPLVSIPWILRSDKTDSTCGGSTPDMNSSNISTNMCSYSKPTPKNDASGVTAIRNLAPGKQEPHHLLLPTSIKFIQTTFNVQTKTNKNR